MKRTIGISLMPNMTCAGVYWDGRPEPLPLSGSFGSMFAEAKHSINADAAVGVISAVETLPWKKALVREAARQGLALKRFVTPSAAAILEDCRRTPATYCRKESQVILAGSLIGGRFDAAVVEAGDGIIEILAVGAVGSPDPEQIGQELDQVLADCARTSGDISRLLLVGDAASNPQLRSILSRYARSGAAVGQYTREDTVLGAAFYGAIIDGAVKDLILLDVLPKSLGIKVTDGSFYPIVPRNTTIPVFLSAQFSAAREGQTELLFPIYEGESPEAEKNTLLGRARITGMTPKADGAEPVELIFHVDLAGDLRLEARSADGQPLQVLFDAVGDEPRKAAEPKKQSPAKAEPPEELETVLKFLPVYDDLILALEHPTKDPAYRRGLELALKKMTNIFREQGVEFYAEPGEAFDPYLHEAVMHTESASHGTNVIVKVLRKGVRASGKIIRYAMVQVAN